MQHHQVRAKVALDQGDRAMAGAGRDRRDNGDVEDRKGGPERAKTKRMDQHHRRHQVQERIVRLPEHQHGDRGSRREHRQPVDHHQQCRHAARPPCIADYQQRRHHDHHPQSVGQRPARPLPARFVPGARQHDGRDRPRTERGDEPIHIECFDNSNFQGSFPVSACVCFKNGLPSKNDYRKFNVKTVDGINDFATMKEAVYRHYKRGVDEKRDLPQLTIIDGGKGQLSAALEAVAQLGLQGKLTLIGLAKNEEELFFANDKQSIKLDWNSEGLKLIRRIRDEVHRFGITFHRSKRSKGAIKNELENIKGIGENTITILLKKYKSVTKIKEQNFEDLEQVIGKQKAQLLVTNFAR